MLDPLSRYIRVSLEASYDQSYQMPCLSQGKLQWCTHYFISFIILLVHKSTHTADKKNIVFKRPIK